jgi:hypothetical protein
VHALDRYRRQPNNRTHAAVQRGVQLARGEFITIIDFGLPDALQTLVRLSAIPAACSRGSRPSSASAHPTTVGP